MIVTISGVEYELQSMTFGEDLNTMRDSFIVNADNPDSPNVKFDTEGLYVNQLLSCLKRWTFRGFNKETGELVAEGDVLPINRDTVRGLPATHGKVLVAQSRKMNGIGEVEIKN